MKLAALGLSAILTSATFASLVPSASALEVRSGVTLGAPLYAGPNVVIVTGGGRTYGQPPPSYRYGNRHNHRHNHHYGRGGRGYDRYGFDRYGYDRSGFDHQGYDRHGYDRHGYDRRGYDRRGYSRHAYGRGPGRERHQPHYRERHQPTYGYGRDTRGARDQHRGSRITILGASYRSIDGRACDAFAHVHKKCDGDDSCKVKASNKICGDPDRGRLKVLEVTYACGNRQFQSRTPERSSSRLSCR